MEMTWPRLAHPAQSRRQFIGRTAGFVAAIGAGQYAAVVSGQNNPPSQTTSRSPW